MRRLLIGGALLAVMSLSGCASESPADKSSGGSGAEGRDSTTGNSADIQSPSTTLPYSDRASVDDCPNQMENSPAKFDPSGGTYAVHITDFPTAQSPLTFDAVQWMTGERAREAFERDTGDSGGPPNDYYVVNESTERRSARLADDARVWLTFFFQGATVMPKSATIEELPAYVKSVSELEIKYWLTFADGEITEVCEQWVP